MEAGKNIQTSILISDNVCGLKIITLNGSMESRIYILPSSCSPPIWNIISPSALLPSKFLWLWLVRIENEKLQTEKFNPSRAVIEIAVGGVRRVWWVSWWWGSRARKWYGIIVGDLWLFSMKNVNHGYIMAFSRSRHFSSSFLIVRHHPTDCVSQAKWRELLIRWNVGENHNSFASLQ